MGKRYRRLWKVVRDVIIENYEVLSKRSIRGSYYIVGDCLAPLIGNEISLEDYNYFGTQKAYNIYRDDIWTFIEQRHGLKRPKAYPEGIVIDSGIEKPLSKLEEDMELGLRYIWDQARGFIFVEKADEAKDLKPLSNYGWTIWAGKGYPTRLMRKLLKEDTRPVYVLHDWDRDGEGIYRALGFQTRRTKHLDIALGDRVTDLGLTEEDVKKLKLPTRPSPPKYKGKPRVELSALEILAVRIDVENPVLAYCIAKMLAKGLMISPLEMNKEELLARHLRWTLTEGLSDLVSQVVKDFMEKIKGSEIIEGEAVEGRLKSAEIISADVTEALWKTAKNLLGNLRWRRETDLHEEALQSFANDELMKLLST